MSGNACASPRRLGERPRECLGEGPEALLVCVADEGGALPRLGEPALVLRLVEGGGRGFIRASSSTRSATRLTAQLAK